MKVQIKEVNRVFDGFFKMDEATLQHERFDGSMSPEIKRLNFERGDAVACLLWNTDTQKAIFTKQFRYPTYTKGQGWMVEAIAGGIGEGESPEEALAREVEEEAGYQISECSHYATCFLSPGGSSERIHIYYAQTDESHRINEGGGVDSENEDIALLSFTKEELRKQLANSEINDAKTLIAVMHFLSKH